MSTYAAAVEDEEMGLHSNKTRRGAIEDALEPLLEAVGTGHNEPGEYVVVVHTDPVWCQKAQRFCEEHDHEEHAQWLTGCATWKDVHVEVYFTDPEDDECDPAWRFTGPIERLREAFPSLVWGRHNRHVLTGSLLPGHGRKDDPDGYGWVVLVDMEWGGYGLDGPLTDDLASGESNGILGDDPIAGLRAIIEAEGTRLGKEAAARAEAARALLPTPPSAAATSPDSPPST